MKSKMTMRIVCAVLTLLLVVGMVPAQVNAASTYVLGDANGDGKVTVADATLVQKHAARMVTLDSVRQKAADVDFDGKVTVKDATLIQKYCARMIDSFYFVSCNAWTSLYTKTTKKISVNANADYTVKITYTNGSGWLKYTKNEKERTITLETTEDNTTGRTREATVRITTNGKVLTIKVKQLAKNDITSANAGKYNCYTYALQLSSDPRKPGGSSVSGLYVNPGALSNSSWDYSKYNVINYRNNRTAMFEDAEAYIINTVEADLATMGWGIKEVSSPNAKVAEGNWVIALALNPTECYKGTTRTATVTGQDIGNLSTLGWDHDYHWYRRIDSANGTPLRWEHKMGGSNPETISFAFPKNPNGIPGGIVEANGHKLCTVDYYWDCFGGYADAFDNDKSASFSYFRYCGSTRKVSKNARAGEFLLAEKMIDAYVLIGYYEVGPNVG